MKDAGTVNYYGTGARKYKLVFPVTEEEFPEGKEAYVLASIG